MNESVRSRLNMPNSLEMLPVDSPILTRQTTTKDKPGDGDNLSHDLLLLIKEQNINTEKILQRQALIIDCLKEMDEKVKVVEEKLDKVTDKVINIQTPTTLPPQDEEAAHIHIPKRFNYRCLCFM